MDGGIIAVYKGNHREEDNGEADTITTIKTLDPNYPNPFSTTTKIPYEIKEKSPAKVVLNIYNSLGVKLATLVDEDKSAGQYEATFDASAFGNGVYFYQLIINGQSFTKQMIALRE